MCVQVVGCKSVQALVMLWEGVRLDTSPNTWHRFTLICFCVLVTNSNLWADVKPNVSVQHKLNTVVECWLYEKWVNPSLILSMYWKYLNFAKYVLGDARKPENKQWLFSIVSWLLFFHCSHMQTCISVFPSGAHASRWEGERCAGMWEPSEILMSSEQRSLGTSYTVSPCHRSQWLENNSNSNVDRVTSHMWKKV